MAALNAIAREWADELREGIAWVIVWKTGRSWNAQAVWLNCDDDTFEPEDLELARKVLEQDPNAVMLNGYYCGRFGEDMTVAELAAGIRWHYDNGYNQLDGSTAFPPEPMERPANLPADIPWYGKPTTEGPDPYVYDGYMSPEDYEHMHELMAADRQHEDAQQAEHPPDELAELRNPPTMDLTITLTPDMAAALLDAIAPRIVKLWESVKSWINEAAKALSKFAAAISKTAAEAVNNLVDAMLYNANDHPKWWHLYKHAKKRRTRKKYRRLLMQQLTRKLAAAASG
nr:MAG TPA: Large polyvalent-protein-associated domain 15 [Caudoviricetes sp.]